MLNCSLTGYIYEDMVMDENNFSAASCPHCRAVPLDSDGSLPVEVSNVDMKFGTIIWFPIEDSFTAGAAGIVIYHQYSLDRYRWGAVAVIAAADPITLPVFLPEFHALGSNRTPSVSGCPGRFRPCPGRPCRKFRTNCTVNQWRSGCEHLLSDTFQSGISARLSLASGNKNADSKKSALVAGRR